MHSFISSPIRLRNHISKPASKQKEESKRLNSIVSETYQRNNNGKYFMFNIIHQLPPPSPLRREWPTLQTPEGYVDDRVGYEEGGERGGLRWAACGREHDRAAEEDTRDEDGGEELRAAGGVGGVGEDVLHLLRLRRVQGGGAAADAAHERQAERRYWGGGAGGAQRAHLRLLPRVALGGDGEGHLASCLIYVGRWSDVDEE